MMAERNTVRYFLMAAITVLVFAAIYFVYHLRAENQIERYNQRVINTLADLNNKSELIETLLDTTPQQNLWPRLERAFKEKDILVLIYRNEKLLYWNNNIIPNAVQYIDFHDRKVYHNQSGWYLANHKQYGEYDIYLFRNILNVLGLDKNGFQNNTSEEIYFTTEKENVSNWITDEQGEKIVGIVQKNVSGVTGFLFFILFFLFLLTYLFIALGIQSFYNGRLFPIKNWFVRWLFLFIDILIIRLVEYYLQFPALLKNTELFKTSTGLPPGFNSPGDQLISGILILFLAISLYQFFQVNIKGQKINLLRTYLIIWDVAVWVVSFVLFVYVFQLIQSLPYNAFIGIKVSGLKTYIALMTILITAATLLFAGRAFGSHIVKIPVPFGLHIFIFILLGSICYALFPGGFIIPATTTIFIIILLLIIRFPLNEQGINILKYLLIIILFAASFAVVINTSENKKSEIHQKKTAELLSITKDKELEKEFLDFENNINKDSVFTGKINRGVMDVESQIKEYISNKYFKKSQRKYDIQVTLCKKDQLIEIQPEGIVSGCSEYFDEMIKGFGSETKSHYLYLLNLDPESIYYLGKLSFPDPNDTTGYLNVFIEFYNKFIPEGIGYPELLANRKSDIYLSNYSYARYKDDVLIYKFGDFPYHTNYHFLSHFPEKQFFTFDRYVHYQIRISGNDYLVVSRPYKRLSVQLLSFSLLFFLFTFSILLVLFILYWKDIPRLLQQSFQARLQLIFISTVSIIIILLAVITLYYINQSNENKLVEQLNEKTNSVIIELQHKLSGVTDLNNVQQPELEQMLIKFSRVFFTDINLYSPSGHLIASSRPEIFNLGLLSENINPMAFEELMVKSRLFYFTREKIGEVSYYSSYAPLELGGATAAGIVNLPYFAKQTEVTQAYYLMIFTFINLFVFLGIIGAVIAVGLSRIITRPLKVLQENIAAIQIDKPNKPIPWANEDEIGKLIREYNKMIDKLEQSAEMLKQSERESAWREVAQQIAHEIKNPLTPMKLNVQYLEKAFREKDKDLDEKVKNISNSLISQIESLDKVAEMFYDLAKSRIRNFERVNLDNVIRESIQLFKNNTSVHIDYRVENISGKPLTPAFEKDLLRLFNNLIKNAIQSINKNSEGIVNIELKEEEQYFVVTIQDNGKGIPDEQKSKIFQPYFTTKSTGTGLGLAIVKNIMQEIGGEIGFESKQGLGTTFTLKFRKADNTENRSE